MKRRCALEEALLDKERVCFALEKAREYNIDCRDLEMFNVNRFDDINMVVSIHLSQLNSNYIDLRDLQSR